MTNLRFESVRIDDNHEPMVNLDQYPFIIKPMYYQASMSASNHLFARKAVAELLRKLHIDHLRAMNRRFVIWDAWRPREVQARIYDEYYREVSERHPDWPAHRVAHQVGVFVTKADDPARIPPHSTGGSVDLTVAEGEVELDFGTAFDHFGPESAPDFFEHDSSNTAARANRRWLSSLMIEAGFVADEDEWWHFDYGNQKWAMQSGSTHAIYGEASDPTAGPANDVF